MITVYRIAHEDDPYIGPYSYRKGTPVNPALDIAWGPMMDLTIVSDVVPDEWLYAFSKEQSSTYLTPRVLRKLAAVGYILYTIEVEEYIDHGDQVTFNPDSATVVYGE